MFVFSSTPPRPSWGKQPSICIFCLQVADSYYRRGNGLFSTQPFSRGDFIIECSGTIVSAAKAKDIPVNTDNNEYLYKFKFCDKLLW